MQNSSIKCVNDVTIYKRYVTLPAIIRLTFVSYLNHYQYFNPEI